jgi:hypothetical protein
MSFLSIRSADLTRWYFQFAMFEAIQREDHASLRTLANTFIGMENDPAALLCLDHIFSSPPKLQDLSLVEVHALLSLYLDYVRLLNKLRRDQSLAEGSNRRRLFGYQVLDEGRYLVPEHTLLYGKLASQSGPSRRSMDGYICGYDDLSRVINQLISSRTSNHTKLQNDTCRDAHGFSPCLRLLVQNTCNYLKGEGQCTSQHIQQEQLTPDWYHARLHLILLQFQILNSARYDDSDVKKYVLAHPARNPCGYSSNLKLLAWEIVRRTPSTFPEARIVRKF